MKAKNQNKRVGRVAVFGTLRGLCFAAICAAMSLVLGKFLQIPNPFQSFIRISFENLPVLLAGITLGPFAGALVGGVADLLGCLLYGYAINPIVLLGAVAVGFVSGLVGRGALQKKSLFRVSAAVLLAHAVGSVAIKSVGLAQWYLASYDLGIWQFLLWRLVNYLIVGTAECVILCLLLGNRAFRRQLQSMKGGSL